MHDWSGCVSTCPSADGEPAPQLESIQVQPTWDLVIPNCTSWEFDSKHRFYLIFIGGNLTQLLPNSTKHKFTTCSAAEVQLFLWGGNCSLLHHLSASAPSGTWKLYWEVWEIQWFFTFAVQIINKAFFQCYLYGCVSWQDNTSHCVQCKTAKYTNTDSFTEGKYNNKFHLWHD